MEQNVLQILRSGKLVQGTFVRQFEEALAEYLQVRNVIALSSGTAALHTAFESLKMSENIRPPEKSEVITSPLSFAATANTVIHAGLKPVFADVEPDTFNLDPALVAERISEDTFAIEPVDAYGLPCDLNKIGRVASDGGVKVVEDAAEAIGAQLGSRKIGRISDVFCFSTYAKNIHTGEGGFISTEDDRLASEARLFRNQGQVSRYNQVVMGYNYPDARGLRCHRARADAAD